MLLIRFVEVTNSIQRLLIHYLSLILYCFAIELCTPSFSSLLSSAKVNRGELLDCSDRIRPLSRIYPCNDYPDFINSNTREYLKRIYLYNPGNSTLSTTLSLVVLSSEHPMETTRPKCPLYVQLISSQDNFDVLPSMHPYFVVFPAHMSHKRTSSCFAPKTCILNLFRIMCHFIMHGDRSVRDLYYI